MDSSEAVAEYFIRTFTLEDILVFFVRCGDQFVELVPVHYRIRVGDGLAHDRRHAADALQALLMGVQLALLVALEVDALQDLGGGLH